MAKKIKQSVSLSQEGLDEIKAELNELVDIKLPAVITRVAKAREHGDLSENAEYHSARDDQQLLQARIDELQDIIAGAKIIKVTRSHSKVGMGSIVTIIKKGTKTEKVFQIAGEFESDPKNGKVSNSSPIGSALMGKKKGDKTVVKAPAGEIEYEIVSIK